MDGFAQERPHDISNAFKHAGLCTSGIMSGRAESVAIIGTSERAKLCRKNDVSIMLEPEVKSGESDCAIPSVENNGSECAVPCRVNKKPEYVEPTVVVDMLEQVRLCKVMGELDFAAFDINNDVSKYDVPNAERTALK